MRHQSSGDDRRFQAEVESCSVTPAQFDHRAHVKLAYVYLTQNDTDAAHDRMRETLHAFLACHGITPAKIPGAPYPRSRQYHETITRAWILAVRHFMDTGTRPLMYYVL